LKRARRIASATSSVPTPTPKKVSQRPTWPTSQPKFCPKKPVSQLSGRKIVAITASCFITTFSRFETVER
jgi:hypothetical protein